MNLDQLVLRPFQQPDQDACKALVLAGLQDHWGVLDLSLNPDLNDIAASYAAGLFLTAWLDDELAGTGALLPAQSGSWQVVRMSVARRWRGQGLGGRILAALESHAKKAGAARLVLETTADWLEVVRFYHKAGYLVSHRAEGDLFFYKDLPTA